MRAKILFVVANIASFGITGEVAHAGLINLTSTVNISFEYEDPGPLVAPSQVFSTAAPGPFSLAAPIIPPTTPMYTTEPYNLTSVTGFWFTNTTVTIYNNATPPVPFCFSSSNTGSSCADSYNTFDFVFTNEDIIGVSVDPSSSADFLPATFGSHTGLTLVSPTEFTVDVTGDDPAFLSTLVIDVTTKGSSTTIPEPSTWALMLLGFAGLGFLGYRGMGRKDGAAHRLRPT
jgi:hypothetical protein